MFGSRNYGLGPGSNYKPYTASGSSGFGGLGGLMGGLTSLNPFGKSTSSYFSGSSSSTGSFTWTSIIGYLISILTMLLIILLLVHYFIRPIFQMSPGGAGFIPVPGLNDNEVFWKVKTILAPIDDIKTAVSKVSFNWSMTLDIVIKNPMSLGTANRVFFSRGSLLTVALMPTTTDMVVTVRNSANNEEPLTIKNVPVLTPFRLGIVIMDRAVEVYINGKLLRSRTLASTPLDGGGTFNPPQGPMAELASVNNLIIWKRTLSPSEIRYASPALMTLNPTDVAALPTVDSCGIGDVAENLKKSVEDITGQNKTPVTK